MAVAASSANPAKQRRQRQHLGASKEKDEVKRKTRTAYLKRARTGVSELGTRTWTEAGTRRKEEVTWHADKAGPLAEKGGRRLWLGCAQEQRSGWVGLG